MKVILETKKLPGFQEAFHPVFHSDTFSFRIILKNLNYSQSEEKNTQENTQENTLESRDVPETGNNSKEIPENVPEIENVPENVPELDIVC